jgi:hypothetical protein
MQLLNRRERAADSAGTKKAAGGQSLATAKCLRELLAQLGDIAQQLGGDGFSLLRVISEVLQPHARPEAALTHDHLDVPLGRLAVGHAPSVFPIDHRERQNRVRLQHAAQFQPLPRGFVRQCSRQFPFTKDRGDLLAFDERHALQASQGCGSWIRIWL